MSWSWSHGPWSHGPMVPWSLVPWSLVPWSHWSHGPLGLPFLNAGFVLLACRVSLFECRISLLACRVSLLACRVSLFACRVSLFECRFPLFECRISLFENRICPRIFQDFGRYPPKCFLAITCTIWLRLEFRDRGSAWFFSPHLLFFHARGWIFEPRIGFWIPRSTFWPGDLFWSKMGPEKSKFVTETFCHGSSGEIPKPK